jgi:hypothetical protein
MQPSIVSTMTREREMEANLKREEAYKREHKPAAALDRHGEDRRAEYRAANYKPPVLTAPTNSNELWRSVTNGYTIICEKNPAGGTRTYVEKNDAYYDKAAQHDDGL